MPKIEFSMERGSFFRVILGIAMVLFFVVNAIIFPEDHYRNLFWILIALVLTWQQYSLYLIKKQKDVEDKKFHDSI